MRKLNYDANEPAYEIKLLMRRVDSLEKTRCWEGLGAGGEGGDGG